MSGGFLFMLIFFVLSLIVILLLVLAVYLHAVFHFHDLHIPDLVLPADVKRALIVFPHPDDETVFTSGLISHMLEKGVHVTLVSLTKGEKGDELLKLKPGALGDVRKKEFERAATALGVTDLRMLSLPDSKLADNKELVHAELNKIVEETNPDLIVTYEKNGMYGHPDHVMLSSCVFKISGEKKINAIYATLPEYIFNKHRLPSALTIDGAKVMLQQNLPAEPMFKLPIWRYMLKKYKALKAYNSQNLSWGVPLPISVIVMPYEYFTTRYDETDTNKNT